MLIVAYASAVVFSFHLNKRSTSTSTSSTSSTSNKTATASSDSSVRVGCSFYVEIRDRRQRKYSSHAKVYEKQDILKVVLVIGIRLLVKHVCVRTYQARHTYLPASYQAVWRHETLRCLVVYTWYLVDAVYTAPVDALAWPTIGEDWWLQQPTLTFAASHGVLGGAGYTYQYEWVCDQMPRGASWSYPRYCCAARRRFENTKALNVLYVCVCTFCEYN